MANPFDDPVGPYYCLVNDEGQYSIWPDYIDVPRGWVQVGPVGDKETCLTWINDAWKDMRPLSLKTQMEQDSEAQAK
jgi:MbtH protein